MATYYVRPAGGSYGLEDGSSYDNAFNGWTAAMTAAVLGPGVTLYVCGYHDESTSTAALSAGGASGDPVYIRGDAPEEMGELIVQDQWAMTRDYVEFKNIDVNNSLGTDNLFYVTGDRTDLTLDGVTTTKTNRLFWRSIGLMTNLTIKNCTIHNNGGDDLDYVIYCVVGDDNREIGFVNLVIEDNTIMDCRRRAVTVRNSGVNGAPKLKLQGLSVCRNTITNCDMVPIRISGNRHYVGSVTAGNPTTFTLDSNHYYSAGDEVHIHDIAEVSGPPIPDGVYTINTATPGTNTFTVAIDTTGGVYTTPWPYAGYVSSPYFTDTVIDDNIVEDILDPAGESGGFLSLGCFRSSTGDMWTNRVTGNVVRRVRGIGGGGVFVDCIDLLYENNLIDTVTLGPNDLGGLPESSFLDAHGVDIDVGNVNVVVRKNKFLNIIGNLQATSFPDNSGAGVFVLANSNVEVYGNYIENAMHGLMVANAGHRHNNIVFANNTCVNCSHVGIPINESANSDTIYFWNNIISGAQYGYYDRRNNNVIYGSHNVFHNISVSTYYQNGANYSTTDDLTTDPQLDANGKPSPTSPCIGAGYKWWTGPNPVDVAGEPFADFDLDRGGYQSTYGPFHPANL